MKKISRMTIGELAAYISDYLEEHGHRCILSGGGCVSIYTENKYESFDLDFVPLSSLNHKKLTSDLNEIGFYEDGRCFRHPETNYYLDFPAPPPSLGEEPVKDVNLVIKGTHTIRMLTPTDSVKDRLCAFYFWNDNQALNQAIMLAHDQSIDIDEIKRWSKREDQSDKFRVFEKLLERG